MLRGKLDKAYDEREIDNESEYRDLELRQILGLRDEGRLTPPDGYAEIFDRDGDLADILLNSDVRDLTE